MIAGGHYLLGEPLPGPYEEGSGPFSAEFWEMLAPRLTSLVFVLADPEPDIVDIPLAWLNQMQNLQILELKGRLAPWHMNFVLSGRNT